jgi:hypothetical protein
MKLLASIQGDSERVYVYITNTIRRQVVDRQHTPPSRRPSIFVPTLLHPRGLGARTSRQGRGPTTSVTIAGADHAWTKTLTGNFHRSPPADRRQLPGVDLRQSRESGSEQAQADACGRLDPHA